MDNSFYVYQHVTPDGLYYFGTTNNTKVRFRPSAYKTTSLKPYIDKYGWDNIKHFVLFQNKTYEESRFIEDFLINTAKEDGVCINNRRSGLVSKNDIYFKQYREEHKDVAKEYSKKYREENADKLNEKRNEYYTKKRSDILEYHKEYYVDNIEKIKDYQKSYREEHKEELREYKKEYYEKTKENRKIKRKEYYEKNKERIKEKSRLYKQNKKRNGNKR